MSLRLNQRALTLVEQLVADAEARRVAVAVLPGGTRMVDCGIAAPGGLEAGLAFSAVSMGGLGHVTLTHMALDSWQVPAVQVWTDQPAIACLAAQYAGWAVQHAGYFAMGSGPARALIRAETELYERLNYMEQAEVAVLCLEGRTPPTPEVAAFIATRAGVMPDRLTLLIAPTASIVGAMQVAARVVETGLHKLLELGFDTQTIRSAFGTCPIAPVAQDDLRALGRTNDCILYGGIVHYTVHTDDDAIAAVIDRVPSASSPTYGQPFYDIFAAHEHNFYTIDPMLFSPAEVFMTNAASGRTFHAGRLNAAVLRRSFFA